MSMIGFDIGNESCIIAAEKRGGIDVLLNYGLTREIPAVVSFGESQRFLGSAGAASANDNHKSTISQVKRLIGRQYKESSVQKDLRLLPFETSEGPRGGVLIHLQYLNKIWSFTPVEILGMLFAHLKQIAEINLESPIEDCVIGIPSYFTDLQRREYLDAALIAGLKPLRLMHDCTAIALGYGMSKTDFPKSGPTNVIFVDIGHCDTQVTVAAFERGKMKILSHSFDQNLGGRDFDEVLFKHFAAKFKEQYNIDAYSNTRSSIRLRASCEKLKKLLSANMEAPLSIKRLVGDTDVKGFITREEFEILSLELLERITIPCINAVKDSGLCVDKIYAIELAGCGSHIPGVVKKLTSVLWKEPRRTLNASECVARGCAFQCAMLSPTRQYRDYKVEDSFPYSIGFPVEEGLNKPHQEITLFPKGSPFPSDHIFQYPGKPPHHIQVFYTSKTDFPVGISPKVGHFRIGYPETSSEEKVKVQCKVKLNSHGIFEIESASLLEDRGPTRKSFLSFSEKIVTDSLPLSENLDVATTNEELHEAREREHMLAEQDIKAEQTKDQRNTLEYFVYNTRRKADETRKGLAWFGVSENFFGERSKSELHEAVETKEIFAELDIKLLDPIENKNKDENAHAQATKSLLTCIADYRSIADSLPPCQKEEVNNECIKAEQWLNDHSQHSSPNSVDPILWSSIIKYPMEVFERRCEQIMRSKPSSQNDKLKGMQVD